jgi:hypothetical protein
LDYVAITDSSKKLQEVMQTRKENNAQTATDKRQKRELKPAPTPKAPPKKNKA